MSPPRRRRVLICFLLALAAAGAFVVVPQLRDTVPATPGSWARVILWFGGFALFGLIVWRWLRPRWLAVIVAVAPFLTFSVWALAPAFYDRTVNEAFPTVVASEDSLVAPDTAPHESGGPASPSSEIGPTTTSPIATTPHESIPATTHAAPTAIDAAVVTTTPRITTVADAVLIGSGSLRGLAGHDASGQAFLYRLADGSRIVRFEDLHVERAPDLHVYLVPGAQQTSTSGGVRLAELKGNKGNQNYEVPSEVDVEQFAGVLIWCKKFSIQVAGAPLT